MIQNNRNGHIVSVMKVSVDDQYKNTIEAYRIEYLVDGLRVVGFIVKPKKKNEERLPILIYNRGGNREYGKIDEERLVRLASYASKKYIVLASQYRGNDGGEGKEAFGGEDVRDIFALSTLADKLPYADCRRKVMFGHSRGGMMAYICIKLGIDIKAAAVVGAPSNLFHRPQAFPMERVHSELIGNKESEKWKFEDRSAIYWPEKITIPLLIQHGEKDSRVAVEDSIELAKLLTEHKKEHKLIVYPDGNHKLSNYESERDQEIFKWFEKYI